MPLDAIKGAGVAEGLQLCAAGALDSTTSAPEWVNIVPLTAGVSRIEARDGRVFICDDPAALVAASNAELDRQRGPHPVDRDHVMNWGGGPALAWARRYELRADGIYAQTDWLATGRAMVESGEYKYTSCNVYCDLVNIERDPDWGFIRKADLKMKRLAGFTLTNIPALEVYSMASLENPMKKLLARLGLTENATPDEALAAIERLSASASPSLDQFVPRAEFDRLTRELAAAKAEIAAVADAAAEKEREQLLAAALEAGKIVPATAAYFREQLKQPGGIDSFKNFCAAAPKIAGRVDATRRSPTPDVTATGLSPNELKACEIAGFDPKLFAAEKAELAQRKHATA